MSLFSEMKLISVLLLTFIGIVNADICPENYDIYLSGKCYRVRDNQHNPFCKHKIMLSGIIDFPGFGQDNNS